MCVREREEGKEREGDVGSGLIFETRSKFRRNANDLILALSAPAVSAFFFSNQVVNFAEDHTLLSFYVGNDFEHPINAN